MRNRWIWIVGIVAVVVIVIGVVLATTLNHPTATPTATASTPVRTAQPTDTAPTGCLGGNARDASMLLVAQKAAPHTTNGAVEVAAALVRWTFRSPSFSTDEASEVSQKVISSSASDEFKNLQPTSNNSGGVVADGTPFYLSTAQGVFYLESTSSGAVTISIGAAYVINGAVSPQLRSSTTVAMVWEDGAWKAKSGSITRTTEELFRIGTAFTGGC